MRLPELTPAEVAAERDQFRRPCGTIADVEWGRLDCLVAFRRAHEAMRLAADENHASPQVRGTRIRQAFQASGCDEARERLILTATEDVATAIDASYHSLREVREVLASGRGITSADYHAAREAHGDATRAARTVLRRDLSSQEA